MGETLVYIVFPETENCEQSPSANLMALKQQDEINADVLMQLFTTLEKNLSFFEYEHFVPVYNKQNLRATLCSLKATMPMAFPNQQMLFLTMLKQRSVDITGITTRDLECKYKLYHQDVTTTILGDMANCIEKGKQRQNPAAAVPAVPVSCHSPDRECRKNEETHSQRQCAPSHKRQ